MRKLHLSLFLISILFYNANAQKGEAIVENFIDAYNTKDSITAFNYLHKDFVELFEKDTAIASKSAYGNNYAWGIIMHDRMSFEITEVRSNEIETMSTYYSDRDSLLKVEPFKSIRTYFLKNDQIVKVVETKFSGYENYDAPRREKYSTFFSWLSKEHNLSIGNFAYNKNGAEKLRKILLVYSK